MRKNLLLLSVFAIMLSTKLSAQIITSPQITAGFGIDADLRTNFFNGVVTGTYDDWFNKNTAGTGKFVIDTTGASSVLQGYTSNPASLNASIIRTMSYPPFSVADNHLLIDAVFVRDYHGDDSTIFASGSNKNGMSPVNWSSPVAQSVPDKNEILDVFMHVRRAGITAADSLWMFGGISIENTNGDRYFDFEMYQTDIFYNKSTQSFSGYGPDAGHTSWKFDASGNITQPGDIILTAEYGSSALTMIEARIWVDKNVLSTVTPTTFAWGGLFDGETNGAQYGYASIVPKTAGSFYNGLESAANTWGGPFGIVLGDNSIQQKYTAGQFMEFAVNLTKLGLDPVTLLGGSTCSRPFRRVMVKTRASTSFTAALKDFVAPFDFAKVAEADIAADIPVFCGLNSVSNIKIINPISTSVYNWKTIGGHIADSTNKSSIYVDAPGTYIVSQSLLQGCPTYATDTIQIKLDLNCTILAANLNNFSGKIVNKEARLDWTVHQNQQIKYFDVERSIDGVHYKSILKMNADINLVDLASYFTTNEIQHLNTNDIYYRLKIKYLNDAVVKYSNAVKLSMSGTGIKPNISIAPNPVNELVNLNIFSHEDKNMQVMIYNVKGMLMHSENRNIKAGNTSITINGLENWQNGIYAVKVVLNDDTFVKRVILAR